MIPSWRRCTSVTGPLCPRCIVSARKRIDVSGERRSCTTSINRRSPSVPASWAENDCGASGEIVSRTCSNAASNGTRSVSGTPAAFQLRSSSPRKSVSKRRPSSECARESMTTESVTWASKTAASRSPMTSATSLAVGGVPRSADHCATSCCAAACWIFDGSAEMPDREERTSGDELLNCAFIGCRDIPTVGLWGAGKLHPPFHAAMGSENPDVARQNRLVLETPRTRAIVAGNRSQLSTQPRDGEDGEWNRDEYADDPDGAFGVTTGGHEEAVARAEIELIDRVAAPQRVPQRRAAPDRRRAALDAHSCGLGTLRQTAGLRDDVGERVLRRRSIITGPHHFAVDQQTNQRLHLHRRIAEELREMRLEPALQLRAQDALQRHDSDLRQLELGPPPSRRPRRHDERVGELRFAFDPDRDPVARLKVAALEPRANQGGCGLSTRARAL